MHFKDGDLILGMHDLDHVLGDINHLGKHLQQERFRNTPGSDALLEILDQSDELWIAGITESADERPIHQQLESIGCKRIVIRLEQCMAGPVDLTIDTPEG